MIDRLLELQDWLKIILGLIALAAVFFVSVWGYVLYDIARFVWRIRRR